MDVGAAKAREKQLEACTLTQLLLRGQEVVSVTGGFSKHSLPGTG